MKHKFITPKTVANCTYSDGDVKTQEGLAITPADAMKMAERGIPITAVNADLFFDGELNPSWHVPPERVRGVDPAELWEAQMTSRRKIRRAHLDDVSIYGSDSKTQK